MLPSSYEKYRRSCSKPGWGIKHRHDYCPRTYILICYEMSNGVNCQAYKSCRLAGLKSLVLVGRRTSIVLVAPGPVPDTGNQASKHEHNGGVVHGLGGDGDDGGHAEEGHSKRRPSWK
jgi:hypothetical protein